MRVSFSFQKKSFNPKEIEVLKKFTQFLQEEVPLHEGIKVVFLDERDGTMTTGRRTKDMLQVLSKDRLFIDILRTYSHEWVHEFQHQKLGLKDTDKIQDIGGPEENMANVLSGIFMKKFAKEYPEYMSVLYGENSN